MSSLENILWGAAAIAALAAALIMPALLVLLAYVLVRGRRKCESCGATVWSTAREKVLCGRCRLERDGERAARGEMSPLSYGVKVWTARVLILAALGITLYALIVVCHGAVTALGGPGWLAWPVALTAFPAAIVALTSVSREGRSNWSVVLKLLVRDFESLDLRAARRSSGTEGRLSRLGQVTIWTDSDEDLAETVKAAVDRAEDLFAEITGLDPPAKRSSRVLAFESESAFLDYFPGGIASAPGYYHGLLRGKVVICLGRCRCLAWPLAFVAAHEHSHHLMRLALGRRAWPWIDEGVAHLVASAVAAPPSAPGVELRHVRATAARGELLPGKEVVSVDRVSLHRRMVRWHDAENEAYLASFYVEAYSLAAHLRAEFAEGLKGLLAGFGPRRRAGGLFEERFGCGPDEMMSGLLAQLASAELPPLQAPPEEMARHIETALVPVIADENAPADGRILAAKGMAGLGYPWRADVLIEAMEAPGKGLRRVAGRGLENLAGEIRGDDTAAWREWYDSLPGEVRSPGAGG